MMQGQLIAQLQFAIDGEVTKRFHTVHTLKEYTVGAHSFTVAYLCILLTNNNPTANLLRAALTHDMAEHRAGDMPSPAKRAMNIGALVEQMEEALLIEHSWYVELTEEESHLLKMADIFAGMLTCVTERMLGNKFITPIFYRWQTQALEVAPYLCRTVGVHEGAELPVAILYYHICHSFECATI